MRVGADGNTDRMSSRTDDRHRAEKDVAPSRQGGQGREDARVALGGTVLVIAVVFAIALCLVVAAYLARRLMASGEEVGRHTRRPARSEQGAPRGRSRPRARRRASRAGASRQRASTTSPSSWNRSPSCSRRTRRSSQPPCSADRAQDGTRRSRPPACARPGGRRGRIFVRRLDRTRSCSPGASRA